MGYTLVIRDEQWQQLRAHLLADGSEHAAFLLVNPAGSRLLTGELILIPDEALEGGGLDGLSIKLPALLDVFNAANRRGLALVEAHSHPLTKGQVDFSIIDREGQADIVTYLADIAPGRPYGALVLARRAVRGHVWSAPGEGAPMDKVLVTGPVLEQWPGNGSLPRKPERSRGQRGHDVWFYGIAG